MAQKVCAWAYTHIKYIYIYTHVYVSCCSCMCANVAQARPSHASPASNVAQALSASCKRVLTKRVADCRTQSGVTVSVHTILGR